MAFAVVGMARVIVLVLAFIAPYFVTWFWSYSYHPRLSFAMVPALIFVLALLLDRLRVMTVPATLNQRRLRVWALSVVIAALCLPGLIAGSSALPYALAGSLPNDHDKIALGNPALMGLVDYLMWRRDPNRHPAALQRPMRVDAPGELRLPFFFPNEAIRTYDLGAPYPRSLTRSLATITLWIIRLECACIL